MIHSPTDRTVQAFTPINTKPHLSTRTSVPQAHLDRPPQHLLDEVQLIKDDAAALDQIFHLLHSLKTQQSGRQAGGLNYEWFLTSSGERLVVTAFSPSDFNVFVLDGHPKTHRKYGVKILVATASSMTEAVLIGVPTHRSRGFYKIWRSASQPFSGSHHDIIHKQGPGQKKMKVLLVSRPAIQTTNAHLNDNAKAASMEPKSVAERGSVSTQPDRAALSDDDGILEGTKCTPDPDTIIIRGRGLRTRRAGLLIRPSLSLDDEVTQSSSVPDAHHTELETTSGPQDIRASTYSLPRSRNSPEIGGTPTLALHPSSTARPAPPYGFLPEPQVTDFTHTARKSAPEATLPAISTTDPSPKIEAEEDLIFIRSRPATNLITSESPSPRPTSSNIAPRRLNPNTLPVYFIEPNGRVVRDRPFCQCDTPVNLSNQAFVAGLRPPAVYPVPVDVTHLEAPQGQDIQVLSIKPVDRTQKWSFMLMKGDQKDTDDFLDKVATMCDAGVGGEGLEVRAVR